MQSDLNLRGMPRAGGWGNGFVDASHVALNEGGAGTLSLARSVSRVNKIILGRTP